MTNDQIQGQCICGAIRYRLNSAIRISSTATATSAVRIVVQPSRPTPPYPMQTWKSHRGRSNFVPTRLTKAKSTSATTAARHCST